MQVLTTALPTLRTDLVIRTLGETGQYVIKDPVSGQFFNLGSQEFFLLSQMDGDRTPEAVCALFEAETGEPLSLEDLQQFVEMAAERGFLQTETTPGQESAAPATLRDAPPGRVSPAPAKPSSQSLLFWRKKLIDPDRLLTWLEPKVWFFWTPAFVLFSAVLIAAAGILAWTHQQEFVSYFADALNWRTVFFAWVTLLAVTTCHEFAHGLTCKRYGGEVHEIGFLALYLMPGFYCNVSDAWLFPEKRKRLAVTAAGGYFELFLWAVAVFAWQLTSQDTLFNYLAWVVLTICGARVLFNLNPLLKLDGYYLLSDWLEIPNLRQRGWDYTAAHLRWLLWGAPRPDRDSRGRALLTYGVLSWLFSFWILVVILFAWGQTLGTGWGVLGTLSALLLSVAIAGGLFHGVSEGEVWQMFLKRRRQAIMWPAGGGLLVALLSVGQMEDYASGTFTVRPQDRAEIRAPVAGFLKTVRVDEGVPVQAGDLIAELHISDLVSRTAQKQAEVSEAFARVQYLTRMRSRREEIRAESARLARLEEEAEYLHQMAEKLPVCTPLAGQVVTPHLKEQVGHYLHEGDLICEIEQMDVLLAEISLSEQDIMRVESGQAIQFKARAVPFGTFEGRVERIAPRAQTDTVQSNITVYSLLSNVPLRPGMTGYARIKCGKRPIGRVLADRALRFLRTEFWW